MTRLRILAEVPYLQGFQKMVFSLTAAKNNSDSTLETPGIEALFTDPT